MSNLPVASEQPIDSRTGHFSLPWRRWLETVNRALGDAGTNNAALAAEVAAIATALGSPDGTVANIPDQANLDGVIYGRNGVVVTGKLGVSPVYVELQQLEDAGDGALMAFTRDDYGRITGTRAVVAADLPIGLGAVPTLMATGETFTVPADKQILFSIPIDLGLGTLDVAGDFVEVA